MKRLGEIRDSLEGVIPSLIATTDAEGMPNVSYLSHVYFVDDTHVALSNQYFSKTAANVAANGLATVMVVDGSTGEQHILDLVFESSETSGDIFDRVSIHLDVVSREQGMGDVMKLRAVDIYRLEACRPVPAANPLALPEPKDADRRDHLQLTAALVEGLDAEADPERLLDKALEGLDRLFGFRHAMVLVPDNDRLQLTTIASRGYERSGIGSEVAFGTGTIGMAAASHLPVRISDISRGRRYVHAVRTTSGLGKGDPLPLPAIAAPVSQLAVPMLVQRRLTGVLFVESDRRLAFRHKDEEALTVIARHLALALALAEQDRDRQEAAAPAPAPVVREREKDPSRGFRLRFYPRDGSVFVDDDYLIRGVPGRLLIHMIGKYLKEGQQEFLNKEIRRDRALLLPEYKDNLETRLILLRRRLEEKNGPIMLHRAERGRIRLELDATPELVVVEEA